MASARMASLVTWTAMTCRLIVAIAATAVTHARMTARSASMARVTHAQTLDIRFVENTAVWIWIQMMPFAGLAILSVCIRKLVLGEVALVP